MLKSKLKHVVYSDGQTYLIFQSSGYYSSRSDSLSLRLFISIHSEFTHVTILQPNSRTAASVFYFWKIDCERFDIKSSTILHIMVSNYWHAYVPNTVICSFHFVPDSNFLILIFNACPNAKIAISMLFSNVIWFPWFPWNNVRNENKIV